MIKQKPKTKFDVEKFLINNVDQLPILQEFINEIETNRKQDSDFLPDSLEEIGLLLKNDGFDALIKNYSKVMENDIIIYKTNYKDFEDGIRLFKNLLSNSNKIFYLTGPFALMNKDKILKKYSFIKDIIDFQDNEAIDLILPTIGKKRKSAK